MYCVDAVLAGHLVQEHVTHVPEQRGAQQALVLDERQREENFRTALDQDVTTKASGLSSSV